MLGHLRQAGALPQSQAIARNCFRKKALYKFHAVEVVLSHVIVLCGKSIDLHQVSEDVNRAKSGCSECPPITKLLKTSCIAPSAKASTERTAALVRV